MKLLVKKLWFPHSVDDVVEALFKIPQMQEQFDEGYKYDGEMRPRGIKICSGYWPADAVMTRVSNQKDRVYLILTSVDLQGDVGRIHGKGRGGVAIASSNGYTGGRGFIADDVGFNAMAFGEIGHALGIEHHKFDSANPCEMSHNQYPGPDWQTLDEVRFCDECYTKIR
ncbi:MAG: hypothetical protein Q8L34_06840 [Candidatus Woesearchaeota archaeon]|nr:hypothetical protein [Candidatus Woesearchaeota archaeon]